MWISIEDRRVEITQQLSRIIGYTFQQQREYRRRTDYNENFQYIDI